MLLNIKGCSQTREAGQNCEKLHSQASCSASAVFQSGICWYIHALLSGDAELSVVCCLRPQVPVWVTGWAKKH